VLPATAAAILGAWLGAAVVAWISREAMRPLVIVMMLTVAIYTFSVKTSARGDARAPPERSLVGRPVRSGDRFLRRLFGPGTGSFLIFGFVRLFGMDFVRASASAKVINTPPTSRPLAFLPVMVQSCGPSA
jgi:uncharacterized membrane protein YfcA